MLGNQEKEIALVGDSRKSSLVGILLIVLSLGGYMLFTSPFSDQVDVLAADINTKTEELVKISDQIKSYKDSQANLKLSTEVERLEVLKAIPEKMHQDEVIEDLINIAKTYDITLSSISFSKGGSEQTGVKSLIINSSFIGNYNDLIDFLEGIEGNSRIFNVNSISVQINKLDISKIDRASFSLSIETFYQE